VAFFVLTAGFIVMGLLSYFINSPVYFVLLLAALPVICMDMKNSQNRGD